MVLHCWVYGWVSFGGMWGCRPWWGLWDHSQEGTVPSTGLRDCVGGSEITHRHATESADVPWINIAVTLLSLKSKIKKTPGICYLAKMQISEPCGHNTLVMFTCELLAFLQPT